MHLLSPFSLNLPFYEHKKRPSYQKGYIIAESEISLQNAKLLFHFTFYIFQVSSSPSPTQGMFHSKLCSVCKFIKVQ